MNVMVRGRRVWGVDWVAVMVAVGCVSTYGVLRTRKKATHMDPSQTILPEPVAGFR